MIEVDRRGAPHLVGELDARTALRLLSGSVQAEREVGRSRLRLVLHLVVSHPATPAERIDKVGTVGIEKTIALAIATLLPERLEAHDAHGRSGWHVEVQHPRPVDFDGTSFLQATADSLDLDDFLHGLAQIAAELADAGDQDPLPLRMAKALGDGPPHHPPPQRQPHPEQPQAGHPSAQASAGLRQEHHRRARRRAPVRGAAPLGRGPQSVLDRWLETHRARFRTTSPACVDDTTC